MLLTLFMSLFLLCQSWFGAFGPVTTPPAYLSATTSATVVRVIDGDTIDVEVTAQSPVIRVRYIGIDTPEPYAHGTPDCGSVEASARNHELVENKTVEIVPGLGGYDKYHRTLAYVYVDDVFVNETLIAEGYARVMMIKPNTAYKSSFTALFKKAQTDKLGIWSTCTSH